MNQKYIKILKEYVYFILFLIVGIGIFFYPVFQSGFNAMPGDGYTIKAYNYILEHSWLWVQRIAPHTYLWDAPFYYPSANTLAYNDTLMGIMPIYWFYRLFLSPFGSLQFLLITLCVLNYSTFYYLLNKQIKFSNLASSVASFVFAFSILRAYRIGDINCFTQFFTILTIIFILKVNANNTSVQNHKYFILASIAILAQMYSSFTMGFFAVFLGFWTIIFGLLPITSRKIIIQFFVNFYKKILFYCAVVIALLAPLSYHFVSVDFIKTINHTLAQIPPRVVWFRNVSLLDSNFFNKIDYVGVLNCNEISVSIGLLTIAFAIFGFFKLKKAKGLPILLALFVFFVTCGASAYTFWRIFYYISPGTEGLLAISRLVFVGLIVFAIGIASGIEYLQNIKNKKRAVVFILIAIFLLSIEQITVLSDKNSAWKNYSWTKSEFRKEIASIMEVEMPKECKIFNLSYNPSNYAQYTMEDYNIKTMRKNDIENLTGMWVALEKRMYTLNGYSVFLKKEKLISDNPEICTFTKDYDYTQIK